MDDLTKCDCVVRISCFAYGQMDAKISQVSDQENIIFFFQ